MPTNITFQVADAAIPRIVNAIKGLYPIPTDEEGAPLFNDNQWAKEKTKRWWKEQVLRWEQRRDMNTARDAVVELPDDDIS